MKGTFPLKYLREAITSEAKCASTSDAIEWVSQIRKDLRSSKDVSNLLCHLEAFLLELRRAKEAADSSYARDSKLSALHEELKKQGKELAAFRKEFAEDLSRGRT